MDELGRLAGLFALGLGAIFQPRTESPRHTAAMLGFCHLTTMQRPFQTPLLGVRLVSGISLCGAPTVSNKRYNLDVFSTTPIDHPAPPVHDQDFDASRGLSASGYPSCPSPRLLELKVV